MAYQQGLFPVLAKRNLAQNIYDLTILCPEIAGQAKAGQFVHIRVPGHVLRRPISIAGFDADQGTIRIIYEIRGEGTQILADYKAGDLIDVLGPLGNGYTLPKEGSRVVVVGGGIGVPPLLPVAERFGANAAVILGFRNAQAAILENDFKKTGANTLLCTDDGTYGRKGFVTAALEGHLELERPDYICACGPMVMLKKVTEIAMAHSIPCQISLEERMACGVGACLGCACKIRRNGEEVYLHVCKDGPVFSGEEVVF